MAFNFSVDQLRSICQGKYKVKKCLCCDIFGLEYWDGRTGLGCGPCPPNVPKDDIASGTCENCGGVGYFLEIDA